MIIIAVRMSRHYAAPAACARIIVPDTVVAAMDWVAIAYPMSLLDAFRTFRPFLLLSEGFARISRSSELNPTLGIPTDSIIWILERNIVEFFELSLRAVIVYFQGTRHETEIKTVINLPENARKAYSIALETREGLTTACMSKNESFKWSEGVKRTVYNCTSCWNSAVRSDHSLNSTCYLDVPRIRHSMTYNSRLQCHNWSVSC
jgi:hypothetical protein